MGSAILILPTMRHRNIFFLNKRERDVIIKHMFPFTPFPPRYLESWIVCAMDKICSLEETLKRERPVTLGKSCPLFVRSTAVRSQPEEGSVHAVAGV